MPEDIQPEALIEQARDIVINAIAETMDLYGVTPSIGRLYGTMYFKHHPMTLDEMKDDLGMSKPSMSTSVRKLQDIHMVQKVWQKGSRKDKYMAEKNFFRSFIKFFCKKWMREVNLNLEAIAMAESKLKKVIEAQDVDEDVKKEAEIDFQQLEESKVYYRWLKQLVRSIETEEIFEFLPVNQEEIEP
ncbi:DNA-binding transcriptional regulator GbsR (MarR family) [Scopulibacillus daqui]|uniref:HTH-type transcriptional regulator n=1 Tax=Scopulibacillus daqui TaxID=1469162 RepID=A0ABS2Q541_9BACL|nr:GbsR/MarR family transcriptional regulator [Scopulibacillus daqui]MBM7646950.1 DNA-binding transcriptional regulator GbsR (MarR family) [Scopulibacillus daqui]